MKRIRVLVVEDSLTVRKHLVECLEADPEIEVVGEGTDGSEAVSLCERLRPDVVTLDIVLPTMSGLAATEHIMAFCPTPIVIVSASFNRGELYQTYEALAAGAVEALEKPSADEDDMPWRESFLFTVKVASRVRVITHPRLRLRSAQTPARRRVASSTTQASGTPGGLIAIGASTGGPGAVLEILRALPAPFPLPIVLVVHISEAFGTALAQWLDQESPHHVACARDGEPLAPGKVYMAPPARHLVAHRETLHLWDGPELHSCRPSVDVLFESLAAARGASTIACLLTGMGRDGAAGLLAIRRAGGATIAQDEATSIVYGMPREAALLGAAQHIAALPEIPAVLERCAGVDRSA